ncbi:MAG: 1-acyl-sn-glycerol-3-phosphate acyltransferase [Treponema sp.]|jgi:1-acyl-sn-glycerol-3-phosphate acyltransferase|nr:1-acyl-sn-glycerol-3-phosphate acyltransferase [Treponema sp.]
MKIPEKPFVPKTSFTYPADPDGHMVQPRHLVDITVDEHYPFLDKSLGFRIKSALIYLGIFTLVFVICPIRYGLRIEGRAILKKYRRAFKNGAVTVSNHMLRWDFLVILQAIRWRRLYFPAWQDNLRGKDRGVIRWVGGIPVPDRVHAMNKFNEAFDELHQKRKWILVFPEGSNWMYYQPIRPFKKGAFVFSWRYNIPVIPMAFSYREARGVYALFKKNHPLITLRIGEPIFPDTSLSRKEAVAALRLQCHQAVVRLAGITENPWPAEGD